MAAPLIASWLHRRGPAAALAAIAAVAGAHAGVGPPRAAATAAGGQPPVEPCGAEPGRTEAVPVQVGGRQRVALVHTPAGNGRAPRPLVLAFHPAGPPAGRVKAAIFEQETRWSRLADAEGFVVAYPVGLGRDASSWQPRRDLPFARALVRTLVASGCADPARVHAAGASNGAAMAAAAACDPRLRPASVALVSLRPPPAGCPTREPVPVVAFHGRRDSLVAFADATDAARAWAVRNGCAGDPSTEVLAVDVERWTWPGCAQPFVFYALRDNGHAWPGLSRERFEAIRARAGRPRAETARVARYSQPFRASVRAEVVAWELFTA